MEVLYDFHTHFIPFEVMDWLKENQNRVNARWEMRDASKHEFLVVNGKWGFELKTAFIDEKHYLEDQQSALVTHSVVSPIPQLFMYDFEPSITTELAQTYNLALSRFAKKNSTTISALATVPLHSPEKAAETLAKAMSLGLKGAIIGPGVQGHMLSDVFFEPFFAEANRLGAIVFIHPLLNEDPRLKRRMMPNLIGVPWETTICGTDLLLSGFVDQYPNIKVLFAHGGGFMPYQIGRMDKGYEQWQMVSKHLQAPPSEYLKRFWYDSVLWNENSLSFLIEAVGSDRVVPGSDYPFDLSVWPPDATLTKGASSLLE